MGDCIELRLNIYNWVVSFDVEMLSKDMKWYYSFFIVKLFDDFNVWENFFGLVFGSYFICMVSIRFGFFFINEFFNVEVGFVLSIWVYLG